jgi:solute carrier family 66 (lysosomal lysine-arginine transporter), member 1
LGCILTHQLPFQTLLASYYVLVDSVLMFQFVFYKILFPPRPQSLIPTNTLHFHPAHATPEIHPTTAPLKINRLTRMAPNRDFQRSVLSIAILLGFVSLVAADPVDDIPDDTDMSEWIGHVFAWVCCSFYLTSRLPQILENNRRKSTQGINIALFTAALCGNIFYTIGILTNPLAHKAAAGGEFLLNALPYLLGSAGYLFIPSGTNVRTILFDVTILMQYFQYWGQEPVELDREAIKRYLTTDESWVQHRWMAIRKKLHFPFTISFHDGPYGGHEEVLEGVAVDENIDGGGLVREASKDVETRALLTRAASSRSYGTQ